MNNTELSCNNTVCKLTIYKSQIENTKKQIISFAGETPVIFVENESNNMVDLTVIVASLTSNMKKELDNLVKELNSVRKYSESSFEPEYKLDF